MADGRRYGHQAVAVKTTEVLHNLLQDSKTLRYIEYIDRIVLNMEAVQFHESLSKTAAQQQGAETCMLNPRVIDPLNIIKILRESDASLHKVRDTYGSPRRSSDLQMTAFEVAMAYVQQWTVIDQNASDKQSGKACIRKFNRFELMTRFSSDTQRL